MLTKRLAACAALVTEGGVVCDVGTDHAYLPAELLRQTAAPCGGHGHPRRSAGGGKAHADGNRRSGTCGTASVRRAGAGAPGGITDVVVAGMGGETIVHILENCPWRAQVHLIYSP